MAPHLAWYSHIVLEDVGHLLPIERPDEIAAPVCEFIGMTPKAPAAPLPIPELYQALIATDRVNTRLRTALLARAMPDDPGYQPKVLDPVELAILRAACNRILPQHGPARIDLAARIDLRLASGEGDGWRHASLPPDGIAFRQALRCLGDTARSLHGRSFVGLNTVIQDALLYTIGEETRDLPGAHLDAAQMRL